MKALISFIALILLLGALVLFWGEYGVQQPDSQEDAVFVPPSTEETLIDEKTTAYEVTGKLPPSDAFASAAARAEMESQITVFIEDAESELRTHETDPRYPWRPYVLDITYEMYETDVYVSYVINAYYYTGGANGTQTINTFVFDKNREAVSLTYLVPESARAALLAAIHTKLYEINGIEPGEEGVFASAIAELRFDDLDTFYITNDSLVFGFSEYHVGPGALGAIRVEIPRVALAQ